MDYIGCQIEIFPFCIGHCCTTLWVKNLLEIALSLTVFKIFTLFHFPQKSKMAAKSGENRNFSLSHRILLYYPAGRKFARNRSILTVFEIFTLFHFPQKSKMAAKSGENFPLCIGYSCTTLRVKNSLEIALFLRFLRYSHFFIFRKNPRWPPKVAIIFPFA